MKKEPESNIYSIIQNEVEIYDNVYILFINRPLAYTMKKNISEYKRTFLKLNQLNLKHIRI